jgi:hypothetical protein
MVEKTGGYEYRVLPTMILIVFASVKVPFQVEGYDETRSMGHAPKRKWRSLRCRVQSNVHGWKEGMAGKICSGEKHENEGKKRTHQ